MPPEWLQKTERRNDEPERKASQLRGLPSTVWRTKFGSKDAMRLTSLDI